MPRGVLILVGAVVLGGPIAVSVESILASESFTIMVRLARLPGLEGVAPGGRGSRGIRRPGWRCRPIAVSAGMIWASESFTITVLIGKDSTRAPG